MDEDVEVVLRCLGTSPKGAEHQVWAEVRQDLGIQIDVVGEARRHAEEEEFHGLWARRPNQVGDDGLQDRQDEYHTGGKRGDDAELRKAQRLHPAAQFHEADAAGDQIDQDE